MIDHSFHTTRWSLVSQLRASGDELSYRVALGELCQRSWFPIYAYARRTRKMPHRAFLSIC